MTRFRSIMPVLRVRNLDASLDWYTNLLGFELLWRAENDGGGENAMLRVGEIAMMLSTGSHLGAEPALTGTLYFDVTGVEEFFERVSARSDVVWPLEDQHYGTREFGLRDPDGYILAFGEELPPGGTGRTED